MTLMTETQAREKVCPLLPCGREPVRNPIHGAKAVSIGLTPTKCITSLCMMWQWDDRNYVTADTTNPKPEDRQGFCGLATGGLRR